MLQTLDFSGQSVLVFGASKGIGLATAKTLAAYGANVVLAARSLDVIEKEAEIISANRPQAFAVSCDVSNYDSVVNAIDFTVEKTASLDFVVNNAGVIEPLSTLIESDPEVWGQAADINYKGVYYSMRAAIPVMLKQGSGTVINLSSGAANKALVGWSHYCSSKAAAKKLTEVADKELSGTNIRVIGLSPGTVATTMMEKIRDAQINPVSHLDWSTHIPPEWVGEAVAFLCGDEGAEFAGTDFSLKTVEGRKRVGLPFENVPDA